MNHSLLHAAHDHYDEYVGTAHQLAGAGLVGLHQFPGQPGMRKHRVTIFADGTVPGGAPTAVWPQRRAPGAKEVTRGSRGRYRVLVYVAYRGTWGRAPQSTRHEQLCTPTWRTLMSNPDPDARSYEVASALLARAAKGS